MSDVAGGIAVVGRADKSGLASMTVDFCANMPVERALILRYDSRGQTDPSRVKAASVNMVRPEELNDFRLIERSLGGCKVVVGFETLYSKQVLAFALRTGVPTVLFPMYECTPAWADGCDYQVCLSDDEIGRYPSGIRMEWPIDRHLFEWRVINRPPKVVQHNGGNFGVHGRNGTPAVLASLAGLHGVDLRIRSVEPLPEEWASLACGWTVSGPCERRDELYRDVDLLIHPQVIGGCSMPISEATASGIPVIVADIPTWSHFPHRVRVTGFTERLMAGQRVRYATLDGAHLRSMVEDMVSGRLEPVVGPQPPTWEEFRCFWAKTIRY